MMVRKCRGLKNFQAGDNVRMITILSVNTGICAHIQCFAEFDKNSLVIFSEIHDSRRKEETVALSKLSAMYYCT